MKKLNLGMIILLGISIVGLVVLIAMDKTVDIMIPLITALMGLFAGSNKDTIVAAFRGKK